MDFALTSDRPIYMQLMEQLELRVVSGSYKPGERLPAVRDMAAQAGVNPNTMQKALTELERKGLVFTQRTSGRYITEDEAMIKKLRELLAKMQVDDFFTKMNDLGYTRAQAVCLLQELEKEVS